MIAGEVNEAINLYKDALQIIKDSNFMALDDTIVEKMRIDLAELLHIAGRYSFSILDGNGVALPYIVPVNMLGTIFSDLLFAVAFESK